MDSIQLTGFVDNHHRLSAEVPPSIEPGPITIWVSQGPQDDDAGIAWMAGVGRQWADELGDDRQDIYSISDGDPIDRS